MSFNDSLSDMLARIKNAHNANKTYTSCFKSKLNINVLSVLKDEGYIRDFHDVEIRKGITNIKIDLKYFNGSPVIKKITEELHELEIEINSEVSQEKIEEEMGDLLFACSNLARHLNLNPEMALRKANRKFERRFRKVENLTNNSRDGAKSNILDEMQTFWEQVKLEEKD